MNNLVPFECNQFCNFCCRENCPNRPYIPTQSTNNLYSAIKKEIKVFALNDIK